MTRPSRSAQTRGFVVRRLEDLVPRSHGREWDIRFVTATLLFYGLVGASLFLVEWLNPPATDEALLPVEAARPSDDELQRARAPYLVRLPQLLKDRDAAGVPSEPR